MLGLEEYQGGLFPYGGGYGEAPGLVELGQDAHLAVLVCSGEGEYGTVKTDGIVGILAFLEYLGCLQ